MSTPSSAHFPKPKKDFNSMTTKFIGHARASYWVSFHNCKCVLQAEYLHSSPSVVRHLDCLFHHSSSNPLQQRHVRPESMLSHIAHSSIPHPSSPLPFPPNSGASPTPNTLPTPPLASSALSPLSTSIPPSSLSPSPPPFLNATPAAGPPAQT
jgi:hypothetical protein